MVSQYMVTENGKKLIRQWKVRQAKQLCESPTLHKHACERSSVNLALKERNKLHFKKYTVYILK